MDEAKDNLERGYRQRRRGFPPLIGWVAITGRVELTPFLLFAIVALWSPPHFWSLAISRRSEYQQVGWGPHRLITVFGTMMFSILLAASSFILQKRAGLGVLYTVSATVLNTVFLVLAVKLFLKENIRTARHLHLYSILYLLLLFATMAADRLIMK